MKVDRKLISQIAKELEIKEEDIINPIQTIDQRYIGFEIAKGASKYLFHRFYNVKLTKHGQVKKHSLRY